jgi:glycosyltransferase involved in cell wall biosynthesis
MPGTALPATSWQETLLESIKPIAWPVMRICRLAYKWLFVVAGHAIGLRAAKPEIIKYRPHVIHVHDLMPLPLAVHVAPAIGAKVIYDSHELERHRNGLDGIGRLVTAIVEWRFISKAHRVITVCDSIADHLVAEYGIPRPLVVLNAPDFKIGAPLPASIRERIGIEREIPLAVYVGKVTTGRGLEQLVESLTHAEEFHVALLGPRVPSVADDLETLARRLNVRARFHLVDSVPPDDVVPFLATADIGVIPIQDVCLSYRYCLPNKLFELTFAAIPACVSNLPEMRAVVEYCNTGIVMNERDPKDIARAMRDAYARRDELIATGDRLERLKERYSWDAQARKLRALYDELEADIRLNARSVNRTA